ncbi:UTP--glucose-1-phosphate uridylyltransferase GalU [Candidatus Dependentiae bacterium]
MDVIKAVIPAAGLGTRFLPYTKSVPKEMLPLLNKPAIQHIVEECLKSGVSNFIMITSKSKHALENHFDKNQELELALEEKEKEGLISGLKKIIRTSQFTYVRQSEPLGLGHAVLMARHSIGKEYFGILLPDDILVSKQPGLDQLISIARQERASVIAVQEVPPECVSSYGVISIKKQITPKLFQVANLIEKPSQKDAPSNLAVIGRYVLSSKIFASLQDISTYAVGELQLTDAISHMAQNGEKVFAYKVSGTRYDLGTPLGWIKATIGTALQNPHYAPHIKEFLSELDTPESFMFNNMKNLSHHKTE